MKKSKEYDHMTRKDEEETIKGIILIVSLFMLMVFLSGIFLTLLFTIPSIDEFDKVKNESFIEGADYGVENVIAYLSMMSDKCEDISMTYENKEYTLVNKDCLNSTKLKEVK